METAPTIARIIDRDFTVAVVGLGYVGLPLVMAFADQGFRVLGLDIDAGKVAHVNKGESYIGHIASTQIARLVDTGGLTATTDFARCAEAGAVLICVPTPLTRHRVPDLTYIENTAHAIAPHLRHGQLIVLESTTYPTTTEEILRKALETGGLTAGTDFFLAYSPEREDPGNPAFATTRIPKVVGALDDTSLAVADALYAQIVPQTVPVSSARTAEAVKLTENIFRSVNIALVNELKLLYEKMGIDIWEVIEAAKTKPFGFMPFYPGPGLGGHCIPIDPFYLAWKAREYDFPTRFIELAGEINTAMPSYVVDRLGNALNEQGKNLKNAAILLLGLAYKKNVGDPRESPAVVLMRLLHEKKAHVAYYDPYLPVIPIMRHFPEFQNERSIDWDTAKIAAYDAVVIVTDHDCVDYAALVEAAPLIIDTRNATRGIPGAESKVVRA
ncbi:MAG: nucleotide sugar dehydrogenase [Candidatus Hydrogenedentota bacterium]